MRTFLRGAILSVFALTLIQPAELLAQSERADGAVFIRPRVGISFYLGDNEKSPFNFDGEMFDNSFPFSVGAELGYQLNPRYSLGLALTHADYPGITEFRNEMDLSNHPTTRTSVQLIARYLLNENNIAPYLQAGFHTTFGKTAIYSSGACLTTGPCEESNETSFGPLVGFGLDFFINENMSFFTEIGANLAFGDDKADGYDGNGFGGFDFVGATSIGLKINLMSFTPVELTGLTCAASPVITDEPATFTAAVNDDASEPVSVVWRFGDGNTASTLVATHSFANAGTYDVSVTVTNGNGRGSATQTCRVVVEDPCDPAEIVSMTASTMSPDTQTAIRFLSNVTGTPPVSYRWDFGDGNTSTGSSPTHTYAAPGTYTVTLEVTNCGGTLSRTMTITVDPYEAAICREISEMNAAYFDRNSSALTDEGRQALNENLEILAQCPNLNVRVEGLAAPGERRAQQLSEDRARAVEQFYVDNGIPASRITAIGLGRATGLTGKKEGLSAYRRADTIPVR